MKPEEQFKEQWEALDKRLSEETYSPMARLHPLVSEAKIHPYLQTLFPYTSLYYLRFGTSATDPFSDLKYGVAALPEGTLAEALRMVQVEESEFEGLLAIVEVTFKLYGLLRQYEQPYFQFDAEGKITKTRDIHAGIDWIFEQLQGWYQISTGRNELDKESIIFANLQDTITFLAKVLKERADSADFGEDD